MCKTESFIKQKIEYMHNNPVSGRSNLAEERFKYKNSSVRFYEFNDYEFDFLTHAN